MSAQDPKFELTRLERLAALLREDDRDVEAMSKDQLAQYLEYNKVDMAGPRKRFEAILYFRLFLLQPDRFEEDLETGRNATPETVKKLNIGLNP